MRKNAKNEASLWVLLIKIIWVKPSSSHQAKLKLPASEYKILNPKKNKRRLRQQTVVHKRQLNANKEIERPRKGEKPDSVNKRREGAKKSLKKNSAGWSGRLKNRPNMIKRDKRSR